MGIITLIRDYCIPLHMSSCYCILLYMLLRIAPEWSQRLAWTWCSTQSFSRQARGAPGAAYSLLRRIQLVRGATTRHVQRQFANISWRYICLYVHIFLYIHEYIYIYILCLFIIYIYSYISYICIGLVGTIKTSACSLRPRTLVAWGPIH